MPHIVSRRSLLGALVVATAVHRAVLACAEEETPEAEGQQRCEICLQFEAPSHCKIVRAPVYPKGWCQYFAARENAH